METEAHYQNMAGEQVSVDKGRYRITQICLAFLAILAIGLLIAVIILAVGGSGSGENVIEYCSTASCLKLASDLAESLNTSVSPCHDFYHYVCDGFDDEISWINIEQPEYGWFNLLTEDEQHTFLDALYYHTDPELVGRTSVAKTIAFYSACFDSDQADEEANLDSYVDDLAAYSTFYNVSDPNVPANEWTAELQAKFRTVIDVLTSKQQNPFFQLSAAGTKLPLFTQNTDLMNAYIMAENSTFDAMTQVLVKFGLNESEADQMGNNISALVSNMIHMYANNSPSVDPHTYEYATNTSSMADIASIFGASLFFPFDAMVEAIYGVKQSELEQLSFKYYSGTDTYFQGLPALLANASPKTVQFFLYANIVFYQLDYQQLMSQSRFVSRTDFCVDQTAKQFPYVFGYVLWRTMYSNVTHEIASTLAESIKNEGLQELIENAQWLDDESRSAALKKLEFMQLYIGFPPQMTNEDNLDAYYAMAVASDDSTYAEHVLLMDEFAVDNNNRTFWGTQTDLIGTWPADLSDPSSFDAWLTGINAFYMPLGNWFIIPVTISQPPFLVSDTQYPSALTFGGLGSVCGHEMSHGFDPSGSTFDFNGSFVGSIFSNESGSKYLDNMKCFVDQYDKIPVDIVTKWNGSYALYDDGNRTITENVADNAGVAASWTAWRKYVDERGAESALYGVDLTPKQLFFVGWARAWCSSNQPGVLQYDDDVHSPGYARVNGVVQNSPHFAEAFSCTDNDRMNPPTKCTVW